MPDLGELDVSKWELGLSIVEELGGEVPGVDGVKVGEARAQGSEVWTPLHPTLERLQGLQDSTYSSKARLASGSASTAGSRDLASTGAFLKRVEGCCVFLRFLGGGSSECSVGLPVDPDVNCLVGFFARSRSDVTAVAPCWWLAGKRGDGVRIRRIVSMSTVRCIVSSCKSPERHVLLYLVICWLKTILELQRSRSEADL